MAIFDVQTTVFFSDRVSFDRVQKTMTIEARDARQARQRALYQIGGGDIPRGRNRIRIHTFFRVVQVR